MNAKRGYVPEDERNFSASALETMRVIAEGLTSLVHIFNPEMILIGGGVSRQQKLPIDPLREAVLRRCMPRFAEGLQIESAELGNDAGMIGAVRFWLNKEEKK